METDRGLLELAAKAAGIDLIGFADVGCWSDYDDSWGYQTNDFARWNPLTDDGDALRLAVRMGMDVDCTSVGKPFDHTWAMAENDTGSGVVERHNDDPYAATRMAIVRAAADIGREIKQKEISDGN